jgi:hypothetical protein
MYLSKLGIKLCIRMTAIRKPFIFPIPQSEDKFSVIAEYFAAPPGRGSFCWFRMPQFVVEAK